MNHSNTSQPSVSSNFKLYISCRNNSTINQIRYILPNSKKTTSSNLYQKARVLSVTFTLQTIMRQNQGWESLDYSICKLLVVTFKAELARNVPRVLHSLWLDARHMPLPSCGSDPYCFTRAPYQHWRQLGGHLRVVLAKKHLNFLDTR